MLCIAISIGKFLACVVLPLPAEPTGVVVVVAPKGVVLLRWIPVFM